METGWNSRAVHWAATLIDPGTMRYNSRAWPQYACNAHASNFADEGTIMSKQIFLSYCRQDLNIAERIYESVPHDAKPSAPPQADRKASIAEDVNCPPKSVVGEKTVH
jgi:hypothetical protein